MNIEFIDPKDIPPDDAVFIGSPVPCNPSGEEKKSCMVCHADVYISLKNAHFKNFMCPVCFLGQYDGGPIMSTKADIAEAMDVCDIQNADIDAGKRIFEHEINKYFGTKEE